MKAFVFPGQGAQFVGMGKDLYENSPLAKELFEKANLNQMNERGDWIHPVLFEHQRVARRYISDISTGIFFFRQTGIKKSFI